ncbi:MAG: class I SAM-dependent rRNA methyltransferase [Polyangiales bacterium]|nr:class I SAM-dependent rRNA methyltransferase [Myxococcales bacterium]
MGTVRLRAGHVQPVWAGHPWVFAQGIEEVIGAPGPGDVVSVVDAKGQFLGKGYWSPKSAIPVRILSRDSNANLEGRELGERIEAAAGWRKALWNLPGEECTGYRLVHAEGDRLAGLIVDVYDKVAVVQLLTVGMKRREAEIFAHVARVAGVQTVVEVPSQRQQSIEGFEVQTRVVRGPDIDSLKFMERRFNFEIPFSVAQKTGYYFDQRDNRQRVEQLARGKRVLDAFAYVGAFSLAAARGGATSVMALDKSAGAVAAGAAIAQKHGYGDTISFQVADVKKTFPQLHSQGERFDMVIVDPPKLAPTARHLEQAKKAYRTLNASAIRLVEPGGILVSCSCSAAMNATAFTRIIGMAATDAKREVVLLAMGEQAPDHPNPASFPEGRYLKCAFLQVR